MRTYLFASLILLAACRIDLPEYTSDDALADARVIDGMPTVDMVVQDPATLVTAQTSPYGFGDVTVDSMSGSLQVIVRNSGEATSSALSVSLTGANADQFDKLVAGADDCEGVTLLGQATCIAEVRYHPDAAGAHAATLMVSATDGGSVMVDLTGNALTPGDLEITAGATLAFSTVEIQSMSTTQTLTVHNTGGSPTASLATILSDETNYTITSDGCDGAPLGADASCDVVVRFDPTTVGSLPASVSVRESVSVGVAASATGTGTARLAVAKTGTGTVVSTPSGINCVGAAACSQVSFSQTPIQLTASQSDVNYVFDAWTGACAAETTNVCSVPLTAPLTNVGVTFRQLDCTPDTIVCDDATSHYVDCDGVGNVEFEMQCPLGCVSGMEKCEDIDPSNSLATYLDMSSTGPDYTFSGGSTINTDTGVMTNNGVAVPGSTIPNAVVGTIRVLMFNSLTINGTVKVSGTNAIALVVNGNVLLQGLLDVSADGSTRGPGSVTSSVCVGGSTSGLTAGLVSPGGGGAGHYSAGAIGGNSGSGVPGSAAGMTALDDDIVPLVGGCVGGQAQERESIGGIPTSFTSPRGGGGGAVQIVSRTSITITNGGVIDASGGGGTNNTPPPSSTTLGGSGGGSGGSILLEAKTVVLDGPGVILSTKGGGGAAAGNGTVGFGSDGGTDSALPLGGTNGALAFGGFGGSYNTTNDTVILPNSGGVGTGTGDGGGGGGGVGQVRINAQTGSFTIQNTAVIRSPRSGAMVTPRFVP